MTFRISSYFVLALLLLGVVVGSAEAKPRVAIQGQISSGSTLTAKVTGGKAKSYSWLRCTTTVTGRSCASSTTVGRKASYIVSAQDVGKNLRVVVKLKSGKSVSSAWTATITGAGSSSAASTPAAAAPVPGSSLANPIPLGTPLLLPDGWTMTVNSYTPDATAAVLAENMFNSAPAAGKQYAIVNLTLVNSSSSPMSFNQFNIEWVGSAGSTLPHGYCGVIPSPVPSGDVFPGGTVTGNVCQEIPTSDANTVTIYEDGTYRASDYRFFALR